MTNLALVVLSVYAVTNYGEVYKPEGKFREPVSITRYYRIGAEGTDQVLLTAEEATAGDLAQVAVETAAIQSAIAAEAEAQTSLAAELDLTPQQIDTIKQYFNADVDVLFANLSAGQRKFLNVQQGLLKYLMKRAVKEVR